MRRGRWLLEGAVSARKALQETKAEKNYVIIGNKREKRFLTRGIYLPFRHINIFFLSGPLTFDCLPQTPLECMRFADLKTIRQTSKRFLRAFGFCFTTSLDRCQTQLKFKHYFFNYYSPFPHLFTPFENFRV